MPGSSKKTLQLISFGSKQIAYTLRYSNRKTLGITVTPEMNVIVTAPVNAEEEKIHAAVLKRAPWILTQQSYFLAYYPKQLPKKFISGETHLYLGRQYRLKVVQSTEDSVRLYGRFITILCRNKEDAASLMQQWYNVQAQKKFTLYYNQWLERFSQYKIEPTGPVLRKMSKRWGSCTPKGKIVLNPELIKAPRGCIEYVIVHELCHLVHFNHTPAFVQLQSKILPSWEKWKERLERLMA